MIIVENQQFLVNLPLDIQLKIPVEYQNMH